jgi:hypothetical protein
MAENNFTPTQEYLRQIFDYKDGNLYFKKKIGSRGYIGKKVGSLTSKGYLYTTINKKGYLIHRLIFMMFYGYIPNQIDHIDGNSLNNFIENLRPATREENCQNAKLSIANTSGTKGVYWQKSTNKWAISISLNKKRLYFGCFDDLELAELVAQEARDKYHGKFARHY